MGLDGGTIATRSDILRRSSMRYADADRTRSTRGGCILHASLADGDLAAERAARVMKYTVCHLSQEPLGDDVVACRLG